MKPHMVQGEGCGVWQHDTCIGIGEGAPLPRSFHCELCRAALADPFWEAVPAGVFPPALLQPAPPPGVGPGYVARRPLPESVRSAAPNFYARCSSWLQNAAAIHTCVRHRGAPGVDSGS